MNQGTMSHKSLSLKTAAVFVASNLMLGACSSSSGESLQEVAAQDEELRPHQKLENETGVKINPGIAKRDFNNHHEYEQADGSDVSPYPAIDRAGMREEGEKIDAGIASCELNNELEDHHADGSGVSPYPALDRAELREEEDAYVVTFTGDFFDPGVLLVPDSKVSLQLILSGENFTDISPTLMTEFRDGELDWTGTFMDQDLHEQDTAFTLADGKFTATYYKDSPHFEDFELTMWTPNVYFDEGDHTTNPVSFRCGDGRSWNWEPLA